MKVLIVSDTHRDNQHYFRVVRSEKPDMVIHCGDSEGSEYALSESAGCPVHIVSGNCDYYSDLPRELLVEVGPFMVWVVHGHNHRLYAGTDVLKQQAAERGADIACFGHIHVPVLDTEGDVIAVNPGSLAYPRQENKLPSYCIMTVDEKNEVHFEIKYISKDK